MLLGSIEDREQAVESAFLLVSKGYALVSGL
jgi:hypothetical protein